MMSCCIEGCSSVYSEDKQLVFYDIPEFHGETRRQWKMQLKHRMKEDHCYRVCALHFRNSDFTFSMNDIVLVEGAVPTQNLNNIRQLTFDVQWRAYLCINAANHFRKDPESARRVSSEFVHPVFQKRKRGRPRKVNVLKPVVAPKRKRIRPPIVRVSNIESNQHGSGSQNIMPGNEKVATYSQYNTHDMFIKKEILNNHNEDYRTPYDSGFLFLNCINEIPIVYTTKLNDMNIPMADIINGIRNRKAIDKITKRSKPKYSLNGTSDEISIKAEPCDESYVKTDISEDATDYDIGNEPVGALEQHDNDDDMIVLFKPDAETIPEERKSGASLLENKQNELPISMKQCKATTDSSLDKQRRLNYIKCDQKKTHYSDLSLEQASKINNSLTEKVFEKRHRKIPKPQNVILQPCFNHQQMRCIIIHTKATAESDVYITTKKYQLIEYLKYSDEVKLIKYRRTVAVVSVETCCWFQRESTLMTNNTPHGGFTLNTITFLGKPHACPPGSCKCCCKDKIYANEIVTPIFKDKTTLRTSEIALLPLLKSSPEMEFPPIDINNISEIITKYVLQFKILPAQEVELYEIGIREKEDGKLLLKGHFKCGKKDFVNVFKLIHKIRRKSFLVCCWAKRQICIETLMVEEKLSSNIAKFISRPHTCQSLCKCCCQVELNRVLTKTRPKQLASKCTLKRDINQKSDTLPNMEQFKRNFRFRQLAIHVPMSERDSSEPYVSQRFKESRLPSLVHPRDTVVNNSAAETSTSKPQPDVNLLIASILQRFKDVKLNVKSNGKVCVTIDSSNTLTAAELQILGGLVTHAQKIVNELGIAPVTNMPLGSNQNNISDEATPASQSTVNRVQMPNKLPATFQPVITHVVGKTDMDTIATAPVLFAKITNVRSLRDLSSVMSHNKLPTPCETFDDVVNISTLLKCKEETVSRSTLETEDLSELPLDGGIIENQEMSDDVYVAGDDTPKETFIIEDEPSVQNKANCEAKRSEDMNDLKHLQDTSIVIVNSTEEESILGV